MADTTVDCPEGVWTQLTSGDATSITWQVLSGSGVQLKATVGAVAPTDNNGSLRYQIGTGEINVPLSDMAPGIAATRVYAYATEGTAKIAVSHA